MSEKSKEKYEQIEKLRRSGVTVEAACKEAGATSTSYYNWRTRLGKKTKAKGPKRARKAAPLKVFDMPQVQGRAFIVFGTPTELAEFARVYS